jgi:hypothetical protein
MHTTRLTIIAVLALASAPAAADEAGDTGKLHVGLHAGLVLPQLQSELGTTAGIELEAGYRVWRGLAPFLALGYAQPGVDGDLSDPRLEAGDYTTETRQRELTLTVGALWRFMAPGATLNAYAGLGARAWMLETITNGAAGAADFLENRETSTRYGGAVLGGAEYRLGPGAGVLELDIGGSDLPHLITGDVATTAVSLFVGYRLLLL